MRDEDIVLRTDESHRKDVEYKKKYPLQESNGVKGYSVFLTF